MGVMPVPDLEPSTQPAAMREVCAFDPEPWRSELVAFVRRVAPRADADDVVQEAFLRALRDPPATKPRAWLYRVVLNVVRDGHRRVVAKQSALRVLRDRLFGKAAPGAAVCAELAELAVRVWTAIDALPERQRLTLLLRLHRHMDYDEISVALAVSVPTARQHFYLGVRAVREALGDDADVR